MASWGVVMLLTEVDFTGMVSWGVVMLLTEVDFTGMASWGVVMLLTEVDFTGISCLIQLVLNSSVATHIVADVLTGKYSSFIPSRFKLLFKIHHDSIKYKHCTQFS